MSSLEELNKIVLKAQKEFQNKFLETPLKKKELKLLSYSNWNVEVSQTLIKYPKNKNPKKKKHTISKI